MPKAITLKALRPALPAVAKAVESRLERYVVTRHGRPSMVILHPDDYEALVETVDALSDPAAAGRIRRARREARAGRTLSLDAVLRGLERA
ncbi:MAG TPA: type II toxin-antitoxin system Phd/YefM family antitoxin [Elusimicrobiota bacterium]|jgi:prevent-host-death family protein|nr:type II toxin-antitoxin system Phd/YefM family antitoxin [Elusimicrobiota bacterium]